jgi:hypothetical protein
MSEQADGPATGAALVSLNARVSVPLTVAVSGVSSISSLRVTIHRSRRRMLLTPTDRSGHGLRPYDLDRDGDGVACPWSSSGCPILDKAIFGPSEQRAGAPSRSRPYGVADVPS